MVFTIQTVSLHSFQGWDKYVHVFEFICVSTAKNVYVYLYIFLTNPQF